MKRATKIGFAAMILGAAAVASAQDTVTIDVFGYQKVDIPPAGGVNLVGFSFTSDQTVYLVDVFGTNQLTQSTRSRNADKVYVWNGSSYDTFFQKPDGVFYDVYSGSAATAEVAPGAALFLQSPLSASTTNVVTLSGAVLLSDSEQVAYQGLLTLANPYPADLDLNGTNVDWSAATASNRSRNADKMYIWNPGTAQYDSFYLDASRVWQPLISSVQSAVLPAGGGAFYDAKNSFTNSVVRPFSVN